MAQIRNTPAIERWGGVGGSPTPATRREIQHGQYLSLLISGARKMSEAASGLMNLRGNPVISNFLWQSRTNLTSMLVNYTINQRSAPAGNF